MPPPENTNIAAQLHDVRRLVLWGGGGALLVIAALLAFVPFDERILATGVVSAEHDTYLYAPADGILRSVDAREGEHVAAGQSVIRLDDTEWQEKLSQLEARISQARQGLTQSQASMEATAGLPLPKEFWHTQEELGLALERIRFEENNLERARELFAKGAVSRQEMEQAQFALDTARSEEKKISDRLGIVQSGLQDKILAEAAAEIEEAYGALRTLEVERDICLAAIERCIIRTPDEGTVTLVNKRRAGVKVTRGEDLAHVAHGEPVRVDILCGENQYHRIRPGQRVLMRSNAFDPLRHGYVEGTVQRVGMEPETNADDAPRYRVVAKIEATPQPLVLGSTVEARIIIRRAALWRLLLPHRPEA